MQVSDESAIISHKSQEGTNALLRNGLWVVLDCFDLSRLRLDLALKINTVSPVQ